MALALLSEEVRTLPILASGATRLGGDFLLGDGYWNTRIVRYDAEGEFLMEWGEEGTLLGQFNEPHALAMDSRGRLFVADRMNQRIQVFDLDRGEEILQRDGFCGFIQGAEGIWLGGVIGEVIKAENIR